MASNLKGRLARLRGLGLVPASELGTPAEGNRDARAVRAGARIAGAPRGGGGRGKGEGEAPSFLGGWERIGDLAWAREERSSLAFPELLDPSPFRLGAIARERRARARGGTPIGREPIAREELRFFDFETSGLSGGAGTVAFLAAIGRFEGGDFVLRQLFMEDYPGEAAYLEALVAELEGRVAFTYNGKAFDLPLLRTRCVMNGMRPPALEDLDALACARRLWKGVYGGASLGLLEREVLGRERGEDVPGSEIPGIWFEYLRRGDHPLMRAVMAHNASDVASLALLAARAAAAFAEPRRLAASSAIDRSGLGRGLLLLGRSQEGEELLEAAAGDGDEAAGLLLARLLRRSGRLEEAGRALDLLPLTGESCVERAKYFEHGMRDIDEALAWAGRAKEAFAAGGDREGEAALDARIARLRRRRARRSRGEAGS